MVLNPSRDVDQIHDMIAEQQNIAKEISYELKTVAFPQDVEEDEMEEPRNRQQWTRNCWTSWQQMTSRNGQRRRRRERTVIGEE